jgi:hypothetical protein
MTEDIDGNAVAADIRESLAEGIRSKRRASRPDSRPY